MKAPSVPAFTRNCAARKRIPEHPQTSATKSFHEAAFIAQPVQASIGQSVKITTDTKCRTTERVHSNETGGEITDCAPSSRFENSDAEKSECVNRTTSGGNATRIKNATFACIQHRQVVRRIQREPRKKGKAPTHHCVTPPKEL